MLGDTEQKSGYVLHTVLLEGESKGQHVKSQHRGEQETVSGVQICEPFGFLEKSRVMQLQNVILGPDLRKVHISHSSFMLVVLRRRCVGPNSHVSKGLVLPMKPKLL